MNARTRTLHIALVCAVALLLTALTTDPARSANANANGTGSAAVAAAASAAPGAIAQGGGVSLDAQAIRALVQSLSDGERKVAGSNAAALERLVRNEVVNRALLAEAHQAGFESRADTRSLLARVQDEALLRLWLAQQAAVPVGYPAEGDIKAAYDANAKALVGPTQYRLAQVYIALPDEPAKLAAALRKAADVGAKLGGNFDKLAQANSEHAASAAKGGDMGYLPDNQLAPEVLAAVRNLEPGEVVGPVRTAQGLHYLKLLDRKPGAALSYAEAHDALAAALRQRKANEVSQAYLSALNARLAISVDQIELGRLQASLH